MAATHLPQRRPFCALDSLHKNKPALLICCKRGRCRSGSRKLGSPLACFKSVLDVNLAVLKRLVDARLTSERTSDVLANQIPDLFKLRNIDKLYPVVRHFFDARIGRIGSLDGI